jgi:hypothetical protein
MDLNLSDILDFMQSAARSVSAEVTSAWFYFQLGLVLAGAGIALAVNALLRSRIDVNTLAMGRPALLQRTVQVLVDSASTGVFALLMVLARAVMVRLAWPSYVLSVAANLAFAWLIIGVVASGIRNTFVVRVVSVTAFLVAALRIFGRLEPVTEALDSIAINLGGLRLTPLLLIKLGLLLLVALWLTHVVGNFVEGRSPDPAI